VETKEIQKTKYQLKFDSVVLDVALDIVVPELLHIIELYDEDTTFRLVQIENGVEEIVVECKCEDAVDEVCQYIFENH